MKATIANSWKTSCSIVSFLLMSILLMSYPAPSAARPHGVMADSSRSGRFELVVIDAAVKDAEMLADEISDKKPNFVDMEIVFLDQFRDGWWQLTVAVGRYRGLDAAHIVTHGRSGAEFLGNSVLDIHRLNEMGAGDESISARGRALSQNAVVLV